VFADLVLNAQLFFLIAARILAMVETAPLLSSDAVPQAAKITLAGFAAFAVFPMVRASGYQIPELGLQYALLVGGEAAIGLIIGFFLTIIYTAFTMAGQLYSLQMGFGASEVYDPLAAIEIPLVGQLLNLIAMLVLLLTGGFRLIFLNGVYRSFQAMKAIDLVLRQDQILSWFFLSMSDLFLQSLVLSLPILGTLFLISVATGLLSKAAPQMNLLTEGFPLSISVAFIILMVSMPFMTEAFSRILDSGFRDLASMLAGAAR
jgi:flagellar biosynthesis protein FliR